MVKGEGENIKREIKKARTEREGGTKRIGKSSVKDNRGEEVIIMSLRIKRRHDRPINERIRHKRNVTNVR